MKRREFIKSAILGGLAGSLPLVVTAKPIARYWHEFYQDAECTIPVTEDGQPVGGIRDISGNGNHLHR